MSPPKISGNHKEDDVLRPLLSTRPGLIFGNYLPGTRAGGEGLNPGHTAITSTTDATIEEVRSVEDIQSFDSLRERVP